MRRCVAARSKQKSTMIRSCLPSFFFWQSIFKQTYIISILFIVNYVLYYLSQSIQYNDEVLLLASKINQHWKLLKSGFQVRKECTSFSFLTHFLISFCLPDLFNQMIVLSKLYSYLNRIYSCISFSSDALLFVNKSTL